MDASEPPERYYLEKQQIPAEDDDFKYEEVVIDEDFLTEDIEEDLEKAVRTIRDNIEDGELTQRAVSKTRAAVIQKPEVVDDFVRNFLLRIGLHKTLDCFQSEWYELLQKGQLSDTDAALQLPDAYAQNQFLDQEVRLLRQEIQRYRDTALKAKEAYVKVRKERDFHRLHHKRVVQEKNTLVNEIKRLKTTNAMYEPSMKQVQEKYELAMKEKMIMRLERDKMSGQLEHLRQSTSLVGSAKTTSVGNLTGKQAATNDPLHGSTQKALAIARTKYPSKNSIVDNNSGIYQNDSVFPPDGEINPKLVYAKGPSAHLTRTGGFRLTTTFNAHSMALSSAAIHPRKQILATVSDDQTWKIWAIPSGEIIMTGEGHTDFLTDCAFHPSGTKLATVSGDTTVKIWDLSKTTCMHTFMDHPQTVWGCSWHSCGDFLATCSQDNTCKVWDLNSLRCRQTLRGHSDAVNSVEFLPYSNTLVTSSADKTVILWDARTGLSAESFIGHSHSVNSATFNARGDKIATCDSFGVVRVWDLRSAVPLATLDCGPHPANRVTFDPSGGLVAIASSDRTIRMWEVNNGAISSLSGHTDGVNSALFSHTGDYLVSVGSDCTVRIWA